MIKTALDIGDIARHFVHPQEEKWFTEELQKEVQRLQTVIAEGGGPKGEVCSTFPKSRIRNGKKAMNTIVNSTVTLIFKTRSDNF